MKMPALLLLALLAPPAEAAPQSLSLVRADGSLIHYTLDRPAGPAPGLLVLGQGSGCNPGAANPALAEVRAAFPDHAALIVEKAGIAPDAAITDGYADCPQAFHDRYTVSQRVEDYLAVLEALRADEPADPRRLVLFGGSEGGLAMAMLASRIHPDATILLSSATGMGFGEMVRSTVPPEGHAAIDAGFAAARADPSGSTLFAGSTHRFWADILDHRSLDYMQATDSPFLLIQGGRDTSAPLAAARATADAYAETGGCNLTYWEFPSLDHGMRDPAGRAHLGTIAAQAAQWAARPVDVC